MIVNLIIVVFMLKNFLYNNVYEAGCDEAGRGCLAGPVFAAAVILPHGFNHPLLNDSKKLSAKKREYLRVIIENKALAWAVSSVSNIDIDRLNILRASILAMHKALKMLAVQPGHIIVDGNRFYPFEDIPHTCIIRGDSLYSSIAAASVLAKTHRDEYMISLHKDYPCYEWNKNKAYPTKTHQMAIKKHGISPYHRKTFSLNNTQLSIFY